MSAITQTLRPAARGADTGVGRDYRTPVAIFMLIVIAHWAEHLAQATQVFVLGWDRADSRGALGMLWPELVASEWLHYGYAIVMLIGLIALRGAFEGTARTLWIIALGLQVWHHFEHALLLTQALLDDPFFGQKVPTSVVQIAFPRIELHLFYNAVVFAPMLAAVYLQFLAPRPEVPDVQRA